MSTLYLVLLAFDEPLGDAGSVGFGIEGRSAPGGGLLPVEDDGPANGVSSIRWGSQIDSDLNVEKRCWSETAFGHTRQQMLLERDSLLAYSPAIGAGAR